MENGDFVPIPVEEFFALRQAFMEKLSAAAASGDEAAQYVYRRWNKEDATL